MKKVISYKNLPAKFPIGNYLGILVALDYWNAPLWLDITCYILMGVWFFNFLKNLSDQIETDIFTNKTEE